MRGREIHGANPSPLINPFKWRKRLGIGLLLELQYRVRAEE